MLIGLLRDRIETTPLNEIAGRQKPLDPQLFDLAHIMAR
jgi:hypothetical protein